MIKFLSGIIVVQLITAIMIYLILNQGPEQDWLIIIPPLTVIAILTALWFSSHAKHSRDAALSSQSEVHSQEREQLKVQAERAKQREMKKSHVELSKQVKRVQTGANIKVAGTLLALISLGGLLLFTQLLNFGILLMSTAGGGLAGYVLRGRSMTPQKPPLAKQAILVQRPGKKLPWKKG